MTKESDGVPSYHIKDFNELIEHITMLCSAVVELNERLTELDRPLGPYDLSAAMQSVYDFLDSCSE